MLYVQASNLKGQNKQAVESVMQQQLVQTLDHHYPGIHTSINM